VRVAMKEFQHHLFAEVHPRMEITASARTRHEIEVGPPWHVLCVTNGCLRTAATAR
jgi:hypothetical protein